MSLKRTASIESPHAIYRAGPWEWRVLKTYKAPASEARDVYARWLCAVSSPYTYGSHEMGDVYVTDVLGHATLVSATDEWKAAYLAR